LSTHKGVKKFRNGIEGGSRLRTERGGDRHMAAGNSTVEKIVLMVLVVDCE